MSAAATRTQGWGGPGRVASALVRHELAERVRDRWVWTISLLFATLAAAVGLYGRVAEADAAQLTGPSLVTLTALLVPLVAMVLSHDAIVGERDRNTWGLLLSLPVARGEVVAAKFLGRALALALSVTTGLALAALLAGPDARGTLLGLIGPTLGLGLAFLSLGMLISALARRQVTAASALVVVWFGLVLLYDLALLGALVWTDGELTQQAVATLVAANPAGLYRVQMMQWLAGPEVFGSLGLTVGPPAPLAARLIWAAWIVLPTALAAWIVSRAKVAG